MADFVLHTCKYCGQCFPVVCTYCQTPIINPNTIYTMEGGENYSSCISCFQVFWLHCPFCQRRNEGESNEANRGESTSPGGTGQTFKGHAVCIRCRQVTCICWKPEVGEMSAEIVYTPPILCPHCGMENCICPRCPRCGMIDCVCPRCPRCGQVDCVCPRCPYCGQVDCVCQYCPRCGQRNCVCPTCPRCGMVDCVCPRCPRCGMVDCACPPICPRCGNYQSYCQCLPEGPELPEGFCHRCRQAPCKCPPPPANKSTRCPDCNGWKYFCRCMIKRYIPEKLRDKIPENLLVPIAAICIGGACLIGGATYISSSGDDYKHPVIIQGEFHDARMIAISGGEVFFTIDIHNNSPFPIKRIMGEVNIIDDYPLNYFPDGVLEPGETITIYHQLLMTHKNWDAALARGYIQYWIIKYEVEGYGFINIPEKEWVKVTIPIK